MESYALKKSDFKKSLSNEEINELFNKFKNGDINIRNKIFQYNIYIIFEVIECNFKYSDYDKDDLISMCSIALIKAINTFDISKGYKFITYASICMLNEIKSFHRKEKKYFYTDSLDSEITYNLSQKKIKYKILDFLYNQKDFVEDLTNREVHIILNEIIEELNEKDKKIIKMYFGFEDKLYSQKEISELFNHTQAYISKIINKNLNKIKKKLKENNCI